MAGLNVHDEPETYPLTVPQSELNTARMTRTSRTIPVWVRLGFDDGRPEVTSAGFAEAWDDRHVLVQVLWRMSYYQAARSFWVDAAQVRRRVIPPKLLGADPVREVFAR
ncbi:hypothetical protein [Sinomonas albida]|uniref:hypothetical protein n=1 Tax=Sinomonas albida TaxID=369942 RepID=UPI0030195A55